MEIEERQEKVQKQVNQTPEAAWAEKTLPSKAPHLKITAELDFSLVYE